MTKTISFSIDVNFMVHSLSDEDLIDLIAAIKEEQNMRVRSKYEDGEYPELNENEKTLMLNSRVEAIIAYRNRTNINLIEAKVIVDSIWAGTLVA